MAASTSSRTQLFELSLQAALAKHVAETAMQQQIAAQKRVDAFAGAMSAAAEIERILERESMQNIRNLPVDLPESTVAAAARHPATKREQRSNVNDSRSAGYRATYNAEQLQDCIKRVGSGADLEATAAGMQIPRQTVQRSIKRGFVAATLGAKPRLTAEDEERIWRWIVASSRCGMARPLDCVLEVAGRIAAKRGTPFKNGAPTKKWWRAFKRRALAKGCERPVPCER